MVIASYHNTGNGKLGKLTDSIINQFLSENSVNK